ncbi:RNA-directed DNA methylation 4 isoform X2 [Argentina anserina]|uniref:RNA-directed DNA methylation 4 isoform X2 n=1 Tax=Argentina anserina TaxID=57926 RepID=UPI002176928F|nr:RNA-directed DNA methylation 4 isoform X2 [Potentilla anserina]
MAVAGESSSTLPEMKPVIVRVKRKANQSVLDAFWIEINERPPKRPLLDLANLSLSDSPGKAEEELKTKKVFVRRVETVSSFDTTIEIVKSFVDPTTDDVIKSKTKSEERRHSLKKDNKQEQILSKARQTQEVVAKNARFEQVWRSRKGKKEESDKIQERCHFYDVIRVDAEERSNELKQQEELSLEDQRILQNYLPLLREFIPSAAVEVESDLHAQKQESEDEYVYDVYAVNDEMDTADEDSSHPFPLVQVDDEDFYDGPDETEYDSEDSNAENNPNYDYPDEESEDEEEESDGEASDNESQDERDSDRSFESRDLEGYDISGDDISMDYGDEDDDGDGDGED